MYFIAMLIVVVVICITQDIARSSNTLFRTEVGKLFISIVIVFGSVYGAQYLNTQDQNQRDVRHAVNLLNLVNNELEGFSEYLKRIPSEYQIAFVESRGEHSVKQFFENNHVDIPPVVDAAMSDTNILRVMHPQSVDGIYVALANSKSALRTLTKSDLKPSQLKKVIEQTSVFVDSLSDFVAYEIQYQSGEFSEEKLFEMHIERNKIVNRYTTSTRYELNN